MTFRHAGDGASDAITPWRVRRGAIVRVAAKPDQIARKSGATQASCRGESSTKAPLHATAGRRVQRASSRRDWLETP